MFCFNVAIPTGDFNAISFANAYAFLKQSSFDSAIALTNPCFKASSALKNLPVYASSRKKESLPTIF